MIFSISRLRDSWLRRLGLVPIILLAASAVSAQTESTASTPTGGTPTAKEQGSKESKLPFTLRVTNDQIIGVSLKAQDVKLKDIAAELSRRLKIPVILTPILEKHPITTNFSD